MLNKILIFPTDTVYGIGCKFDDIISMNKILEIKKRPSNKRFSVLCASLEDALKLGEFDDYSYKVAKKYWPGALTLIVKTNDKYKSIYGDTIGLRVPNCKIAIDILKEYGPMATTSVNISGMPPLNDYKTIVEQFGSKVFRVYENDNNYSGVASTVVDVSKGINIIRIGDITLEDLKNV